MKKFEYRDRSEETYKRREEQRGNIKRDSIFKDRLNIFQPKVGETNRIRILPPTWEDPEHYGYDVWIHYNVGGDKSQFLCLKMKGQACPVCEALQTKEAANDPNYAKELKAKRKVLVWVVDRKEEEVGPKMWPMSWKLDKTFVIQARNEDTGKVDKIDHPDKGFDVYFDAPKSEAKGIPFSYEGEKIARNSSPIFADEKKMDEIIEYIVEHPIPDMLDFKSYDYIKKVFEGGSPVEEEEDDIPVNHPKETATDKFDGLDRDELIEYATENFNVPFKVARKMSDEELKDVCRGKGVEEPEEEAKEPSTKDRLAEAREKIGKKYGK